jgi:drug/metabolite transporter (DMT)-like permease
MTELKALLRISALAALWGSSFFWIKIGLDSLSPVQIVFARLVLGSVTLGAICYFGSVRLPTQSRIWKRLAVAAFFHNALPFVLFAVAEQTVDSGIAGVVNGTTPVWIVLITQLLGNSTRVGTTRLVGLFLGLAGTVIIFAPWRDSNLLTWGGVACIAAAVSYAVAFVYEGERLSNEGISPIALACGQMLMATVMMLLFVPVAGTSPIRLTAGAVIAVLLLGIGSTGVAFVLNYQLLSSEGAVAGSIVGYLLPVVSVLLGFIFLGEKLDFLVVSGMIIVLIGVALSRIQKSPVLANSR